MKKVFLWGSDAEIMNQDKFIKLENDSSIDEFKLKLKNLEFNQEQIDAEIAHLFTYKSYSENFKKFI